MQRAQSKRLMFLDVQQAHARIQVVLNAREWPESDGEAFSQLVRTVHRGAIIYAHGESYAMYAA
jgi:lysyl-tRNA synthetase class II